MNDTTSSHPEQEIAKLRELNELKSKFIHAAIHQMRTPVSVVRWTVEIMLGANATIQTDDPTIKNLQAIYKANDTIRLRIDDLLSALNIEDNRLELELSPVQLQDVVEADIARLADEIKEKNIRLQFHKPNTAPPTITADAEKIKNIIYKLILNAIDYSNDDGAIDIRLSQKDKVLRFETTDKGIGVPSADQATIFERFGRAANAVSMQPSGYGLGLYIAKHVIEAHNGTIGASSQEGKGSTFWFELPLD